MEAEKAKKAASSADVAKARQRIEEARAARAIQNDRFKQQSLTQEVTRLSLMVHVSWRIHGFLQCATAGKKDRRVRLHAAMEE